MDIIDYHAHLYYPVSEIENAKKVIDKVVENFDFKIGRMWDKPVGPHPVGSCQITVPVKALNHFIPWLMKNRDQYDIFFHANTGDDLFDHTQMVMWLGREHSLNLDLFQS